ncbi:MAG: hypothetical protein J6D02_13260 [Lachnospira sp.]|nr:hypothetical protein [Lachnospira sp.]
MKKREAINNKLEPVLEEQFARELEEEKNIARKGYRSIFSAYFVFLLFMASVTDYLRINLMDGFFLGIMVSVSLVFSAMFGMLFGCSYYCKQSVSGTVMEPVGCVTEFLPFSREVYGKYVRRKLLPWRRGIFFTTLLIHLLGIHVFTRDNAFPHVLFEYQVDWGRYIVTVLAVVLFSWLVSYCPVRYLKIYSTTSLYQGARKNLGKTLGKIKLKSWQSTALIGAGIGLLSCILYGIIHYILYYALAGTEEMMMVDASYGKLAAMMITCVGIGKVLEDFREERLASTWKGSILFVFLALVISVAADSNGTIFYEKSVVVQHIFHKTEYSVEDVKEYELYVEKKLGFVKNNIFLLSMKNGKQVKMNLSRAELDAETSTIFEGTAEWGFVLYYVEQLKEAGVSGTVRDRALMEKEIASMYGEDDEESVGGEVKQCFERICKLSED